MATAEHAMWVTKRYPALNNQVGFVMVPADLRQSLVDDGGAMDTFDHRAFPEPATPALQLAFTANAALTTASPVGTLVTTVTASGGTAPYTYQLVNDDGDNFIANDDDILVNVSPLAAGDHVVSVRATDADGATSAITQRVITVAAA